MGAANSASFGRVGVTPDTFTSASRRVRASCSWRSVLVMTCTDWGMSISGVSVRVAEAASGAASWPRAPVTTTF